jgi:hypothetical protein
LSSVTSYITKEVNFQFRGRAYQFALSHGLFSSAGIDRGSRFLLRVFSGLLDTSLFPLHAARETSAPQTLPVLDAGCGCGVLGICAGGALWDLAGNGAVPALRVRAQDRDELARLFTEYNARRNGFAAPELEAYTEPLLAGPPGATWDLILSNIPAKAGEPVLDDFIGRSAGLLKKGGAVLVVVVNPLAPWFRGRVAVRGFSLFCDEAGAEHTAFAWRGGLDAEASAGGASGAFPPEAAYCRSDGDFDMEGVRYHIDAVHGAAGFDHAGAAVLAAAKLVRKLGEKVPATLASRPAVLVHEPDQGHFPVWLTGFPLLGTCAFVLSGRNILSLEASRRNLERAAGGKASPVKTIPAVDIALSREELALDGGYGLAALFPKPVPMTNRIAAYWEGLAALLAEGGIALIALDASGAERFDRHKSALFTRLGDFRRNGFRALAYRRNSFGQADSRPVSAAAPTGGAMCDTP